MVSLLLVIIIVELLKVFIAVEIHFLKLAVQIQLVPHWCNPFLINNRNMNGNSVKNCFILLNVELQVKLRFKTIY